MASVNRVYSTLKDLVNKDQKGFVSPAIFNEFAAAAQMNIYNRLFDEGRNAMRFRRAGIDQGRDKSKDKQLQEDLSVFAKKANISKSNGVFAKPDDLGRIISINTKSTYALGSFLGTQVDLVYNQEDIDRILASNLSQPTSESPVALISADIEVFPTTINRVDLRYYKLPQGINPVTNAKVASQPVFGYSTAVAGVELYLPANSVDFELPEHYYVDLVVEIAKMIGVNLRDADVVNYATAEKQIEESK
jgi:hypothetical protein